MEKGKFQLLKNRLNKHEKIKNYSGFLIMKFISNNLNKTQQFSIQKNTLLSLLNSTLQSQNLLIFCMVFICRVAFYQQLIKE